MQELSSAFDDQTRSCIRCNPSWCKIIRKSRNASIISTMLTSLSEACYSSIHSAFPLTTSAHSNTFGLNSLHLQKTASYGLSKFPGHRLERIEVERNDHNSNSDLDLGALIYQCRVHYVSTTSAPAQPQHSSLVFPSTMSIITSESTSQRFHHRNWCSQLSYKAQQPSIRLKCDNHFGVRFIRKDVKLIWMDDFSGWLR